MMVRMGADLPIPVIRGQIASGVDLVIQLCRDAAGKRKVEEIAEIIGMENEEVCMHTLFKRDTGGELLRFDMLERSGKMESYEQARLRKDT